MRIQIIYMISYNIAKQPQKRFSIEHNELTRDLEKENHESLLPWSLPRFSGDKFAEEQLGPSASKIM